MLGEEVHTRAVPDMVAGQADAGENYFCFQDCHTHIYIWVKDGRDVLPFWILGNAETFSNNQSGVSVCKCLKLSFGLQEVKNNR